MKKIFIKDKKNKTPIYNENYKERKLMFIPKYIGRLIYLPVIRKNKNKKILVIFHLYYMNSFKEIKYYLNNLSCYNYDLYVTYDKNNYDEKIINDIKEYKNDAILLPVENKGFDLAPFFYCINKINLNNYDIVFKIHSKGTFNRYNYIYNHLFFNRDWFLYLFNSILGPFNIHKTINKLTNKSKIGLVGAKNLLFSDTIDKKYFIKFQLEKLKIKIPEDYIFVAGTCFAEKASLLQNLKNINITNQHFQKKEKGYISLSHALERYICIDVIKQGHTLSGNNVNFFRQLRCKPIEILLYSFNGLRILKNSKLKKYNFSNNTLFKIFVNKIIFSYKLEEISLKNMTIIFPDEPYKTYHISEIPPYKYLIDKEKYKSQYIAYFSENKRNDFPNISQEEFNTNIISTCCEIFNNFIQNIEKNGYDQLNLIILDNNNNILDGLHRAAWLMYKYGENKKVTVLKITKISTLKTMLKRIFNFY